MSETDLYAQIIDAAADAHLALLVRLQAGRVKVRGGYMQLAPEGAPDLVGLMLRGPRHGTFVALECKAPGARTEPARLAAQARWRKQIQDAGGIAAVVTGVREAVAVLLLEASPE